MPHLLEHRRAGGADVDDLARHVKGLTQGQGVVLRVVGGGETGHGVGEDVAAWTTQYVHRSGCDEQGVGGVQTSGHTDDDFWRTNRFHAFDKAIHLDVVGLVAVLGELGGVVGYEGEPIDLTA